MGLMDALPTNLIEPSKARLHSIQSVVGWGEGIVRLHNKQLLAVENGNQ